MDTQALDPLLAYVIVELDNLWQVLPRASSALRRIMHVAAVATALNYPASRHRATQSSHETWGAVFRPLVETAIADGRPEGSRRIKSPTGADGIGRVARVVPALAHVPELLCSPWKGTREKLCSRCGSYNSPDTTRQRRRSRPPGERAEVTGLNPLCSDWLDDMRGTIDLLV